MNEWIIIINNTIFKSNILTQIIVNKNNHMEIRVRGWVQFTYLTYIYL